MLNAESTQSNQLKTVFKTFKRIGSGLLGRDLANKLTAPFYNWMANQNTKRFLADLKQSDLCVNLGCGHRPLAGWVNVDIARGFADVVWDLRCRLPFQDASCSAIFIEHVIEHLSKQDAEQLLSECFRVLQPKGVLRISTPDAARYLRSYAGDGQFLNHPAFAASIVTPLDRINQMMREDGQHLWAYDYQSMHNTLKRVGFQRVEESYFGLSLHSYMTGLDSADREFESLYVEAIKVRSCYD